MDGNGNLQSAACRGLFQGHGKVMIAAELCGRRLITPGMALVVILLLASFAIAADWPQYRGANHDGAAHDGGRARGDRDQGLRGEMGSARAASLEERMRVAGGRETGDEDASGALPTSGRGIACSRSSTSRRRRPVRRTWSCSPCP